MLAYNIRIHSRVNTANNTRLVSTRKKLQGLICDVVNSSRARLYDVYLDIQSR